MSSNSDPITIPHQPGKLDFQIVEKEVSVTQFRRKPSAVWAYLETAGHVIVFTRRGKRDCAIMSIETHACMSGDYERTMREVEDAPSVFAQENREACEAVHKHVRQVIEQGTETTTIPVDANLLAQVEEVLKGYGWTVEESAVLFFMWCVACPEQVKVWLAKCRNGEIQ